MYKTPIPGEIFYLTKDKPYQIITLGIHKETCESMVIYQALFGDYGTYVLPISKFMDEVKGEVITERPNSDTDTNQDNEKLEDALDVPQQKDDPQGKVNEVLLSFLDADSYSKKLDVISSNTNAIDDRLINDMAVSLDCTVDDGPIEERLQGLIYCLKQLSRFEVKRLR
ncbi:MAG: DUF1653 domain-containing protein [Herbinix sp.]|nr:DUF1653 domain-containing protein [Herbinix sp.]